MRNPLNKRLFRELRKDWKKNLVLFILMTFMIGISSGVFVGNDSMILAIDESYEKYNIEDGHFELKYEASSGMLEAMEKEGITVYPQFFKDVSEESSTGESKVRVFKLRDSVNLACVMGGALPAGPNEIAIDRMHADNRNISIGDTIRIAGNDYKVSGLIASPDYSCLFENNAEMMFDAINFDIALATDDAWDGIHGNTKYQYAFKYDDAPGKDSDEKVRSDELVKKLSLIAATGGRVSVNDSDISPIELVYHTMEMMFYADESNELTDFVPRYANQAIRFAGEDLGKDKAMMNILVYVFIAVLAFVFAITTGNKIKEEAAVIGTLRSTGYKRSELLVFYILIPIVITILSSVAGNILGYTIFKDATVSLYYNSYSLLKYETIWNPKAFIVTTVTPLVIMIAVNFLIINRLLRLSPLKFLRKDLSSSGKRKAVRLPAYNFFTRFRLRILIQNTLDYVVLFLGIVFIMVLLGFSIGLPETLNHYKGQVEDNLIAEYQYVLKDYKDKSGEIITTSEPTAEKYSMSSLVTADGVSIDEGISVYGISRGSKYVDIGDDLSGNEVFVSSAFKDKFLLDEGDEISLKDKYSDREYEFKVKGFFYYPGALAAFMPASEYAKTFDVKEDAFSGYFASKEITDIDDEVIYLTITRDDILKLVNQLDHSMGGFADYVSAACLIMGILVIYLLTKLIIEKNTTSISMVKVLGYSDKEINRLYVRITTVVTAVLTVISSFLAIAVLRYLFRVIMYSMTGWFSLYISPLGIVKMIGILLASYFIVSFIDMRQIHRIPLTRALKNVE